jgi:hypothetical protein
MAKFVSQGANPAILTSGGPRRLLSAISQISFPTPTGHRAARARERW